MRVVPDEREEDVEGTQRNYDAEQTQDGTPGRRPKRLGTRLGRVRRAISVIKKRTSAHEDTIREFRIDSSGITLGDPLVGFQGVLRGVPTLVGSKTAEPPE